jgi:hypothetical protein
MKVLIIEPSFEPREAEIESGLESLQSVVGGNIEAIYPYEDEMAIICNEEGKIKGLPLNRSIVMNGETVDIIAGTFLVAGLTKSNFGSLSPELLKKYHDLFYPAELFQIDHHQIKSIKIPPKTKRRPHKSVDDLVR